MKEVCNRLFFCRKPIYCLLFKNSELSRISTTNIAKCVNKNFLAVIGWPSRMTIWWTCACLCLQPVAMFEQVWGDILIYLVCRQLYSAQCLLQEIKKKCESSKSFKLSKLKKASGKKNKVWSLLPSVLETYTCIMMY